jgi:hypothetical protein
MIKFLLRQIIAGYSKSFFSLKEEREISNAFCAPASESLYSDKRYKVIEMLDYQRVFVCVKVDEYPLLWIPYSLLFKLDFWFSHKLKGNIYCLLRRLNGGVDFCPPYEVVGDYKTMFKHFFSAKQ